MVRIAAMGDNVVDCYVANGMMYPGGNTLNAAVFIRRFGGLSAYIGRVADDPAGRHICAALESEGVDVSHLQVLDQGMTAYCVVGHEKGDRVFLTFDLGVSMFEPTQSDIEFASGYDAVHIGRSSGLDDHLAKLAGRTRLSYDFSTRYEAEHVEAVAPLCYLAAASAGDIAEREALALQQRMLDAGANWALVTRGKAGAILSDGRRVHSVAAVSTQVVDTLGAGDTFTARTLFGLLKGEGADEILASAAQAAADTCRYYGAVGYGTPIEICADVPVLKGLGV
ncbi:PfkB family carbohydrate kinase [Pelagibacterium flavum]|uniref:PfkB family carbohydrate kinase n=1 Tax=Pelagibacterium flavum TaxID=2984530 RepID=A0ABY6IMZ3_9HYPH|nr:PfkB family carbohydrate kinase [Pelagibacterium sp. YIM 151497]UYQ71971.1 PfkB family carbohydrate kinase [Pelagibacterium sp. YIM 151497]|tara:strand:+ start:9536 stop:10381 length:846 start_codon:yes stop_codon:yes gene_type:complete